MSNNSSFSSIEKLIALAFRVSGATEDEIKQGVMVSREFLHRRALDILIDSLGESEKAMLRSEADAISQDGEVYDLLKKWFAETKTLEALRIATSDFSKTYLKDLISGFTVEQKQKLQDELKKISDNQEN